MAQNGAPYRNREGLELRLDHGPATTTELHGEVLRRNLAQHLLSGVAPPCRDFDRRVRTRLGVTESLEEQIDLGPSELASGLALREAHRAACISKVAVAGVSQKSQQFLHLFRRRRWSLLLSECHVMQSCRWVQHDRASAEAERHSRPSNRIVKGLSLHTGL